MDQRERPNDHEEALRWPWTAAGEVWTALPGIIESFDAAKQTAWCSRPFRPVPRPRRDGEIRHAAAAARLPGVFPAAAG
jgi:hypothetical protein